MNRLLERIPTFLQEFREYIKLTEAKIPEFDLIKEQINKISDAQFIFKCPEEWFKELYEEPLGLNGEGLSIDERRVKVYNLYNNGIPYNKVTVNNRIYAIIPKDKCEIIRKRHHVTVKIHPDYMDKANIVYQLLDSVIPLDMVIKVRVRATTFAQLKKYTHGELKIYTHGQIKLLEV